MACQLTQDDEEVAMVTMLDTMTWFPKSFQDNKTQLEKFQDFLVSDLKKKMVGRQSKRSSQAGSPKAIYFYIKRLFSLSPLDIHIVMQTTRVPFTA